MLQENFSQPINIEIISNLSTSPLMASLLSSISRDVPSHDFYYCRSVSIPLDFATISVNHVIAIFIEEKLGVFIIIQSKLIKVDIEKQIINHAVIDRINTTKQGRMVLLTQSVDAAIHVLQLKAIATRQYSCPI